MELKELAPWHWGRTSVHRYQPFGRTIESLHREVDRMFDDLWRGIERQPFAPAVWGFDGEVPAIDQSEDEKAFYITAELPGVDEKEVELSLADNVLTIRGERKQDQEEKDKNYYLRERAHGVFRRSMSFPAEIDETKVTAKFEKGVLNVTLPKTKQAQKKAKHIAIKAN